MDYFAGNIDTNNIAILEDASKETNILYRQGMYNTFSINHIKHHDFHPIFCESEEQATKLLKAYIDIASNKKDTHNFDNDSYMVTFK